MLLDQIYWEIRSGYKFYNMFIVIYLLIKNDFMYLFPIEMFKYYENLEIKCFSITLQEYVSTKNNNIFLYTICCSIDLIYLKERFNS